MLKARFSKILLSETGEKTASRLETFALLNLGMLQSLASGMMTPHQAVECFYHVENCAYTKKILRAQDANRVMSHGVQLPDVIDALAPQEAQRELYAELETMRGLCLRMLRKAGTTASSTRASA